MKKLNVKYYLHFFNNFLLYNKNKKNHCILRYPKNLSWKRHLFLQKKQSHKALLFYLERETETTVVNSAIYRESKHSLSDAKQRIESR